MNYRSFRQARQTIEDIVDDVDCGDLTIRVLTKGDVILLQCGKVTTCIQTGAYRWQGGGKAYVSPHATRGEIVQKCLQLAIAWAEHEIRESFMYRGDRLFGPHIDLDALAKASAVIEARRNPE